MEKDLAIKAENISKTFRIPHEKVSTLKGAFVSALKSHGYEEFKALDDVNFEVKKGEFFGIIGRNGSGKSTLLKILAGIYQADKGKIEVNGRISPFLELGIGFNPELSGRDNVFLNAAVLGLSHKQINEKFDDIVEFSEMRRFIDQKVKNYSSGMQVRLMFSTAIHANREILLMDEVLAVGDSNFQSKCMEEFNKYKDAGKTVILVTHDMNTVQRYCDRAMLLRNGKIEMIGDPEEVGNEYIYQNMSDKEKEMVDEKKSIRKKSESSAIGKIEEATPGKKENRERWGSGEVCLTNVELLDENENPKRVFYPFDSLIVRMHYERKNREIKKVVFGIEIFNDRAYKLFGYNTSMKGEIIEISADTGYVDFRLEKVPFLNGFYFITSAIADENCSKQFDFYKNAATLQIMSNKHNKFVYGEIAMDISVTNSNQKNA